MYTKLIAIRINERGWRDLTNATQKGVKALINRFINEKRGEDLMKYLYGLAAYPQHGKRITQIMSNPARGYHALFDVTRSWQSGAHTEKQDHRNRLKRIMRILFTKQQIDNVIKPNIAKIESQRDWLDADPEVMRELRKKIDYFEKKSGLTPWALSASSDLWEDKLDLHRMEHHHAKTPDDSIQFCHALLNLYTAWNWGVTGMGGFDESVPMDDPVVKTLYR